MNTDAITQNHGNYIPKNLVEKLSACSYISMIILLDPTRLLLRPVYIILEMKDHKSCNIYGSNIKQVRLYHRL